LRLRGKEPPSRTLGSGRSHPGGAASRDGRTPRRRAFLRRPAGRLCSGGFRASARSSVHHTIRSASNRGWRDGVYSPRTGGRRGNLALMPMMSLSFRVLSSERCAIPSTPLPAAASARCSKRGRRAATYVVPGSSAPAWRGAAYAPRPSSPRDRACSKSGGRMGSSCALSFLSVSRLVRLEGSLKDGR
jgi:hypothetical protein